MRRWLAILLLVLLPTQATWAAVAGYCVHKLGSAVSHLGHHDHAAHGHASTLLDESDTTFSISDATLGVSHDCGHCHGQYAGMLLRVESLRFEQIPSPSIAVNDEPCTAYHSLRPERPKWSHLA